MNFDENTPPTVDIGEGLRQERLRRGLTHAVSAERLGVATATYVKWELGEVRPTPQRFRELAAYLGWSPGRMLDVLELSPAEAWTGEAFRDLGRALDRESRHLAGRLDELAHRVAQLETTNPNWVPPDSARQEADVER